MAVPSKIRKGLNNINTHTDRTLRVSRPHRAYMRISAIEMEKTRRMTEKDSILERLAQIDRRVSYLNGEKDRLLRHLGERPATAASHSRHSPDGAKPLQQASKARRGVKKSEGNPVRNALSRTLRTVGRTGAPGQPKRSGPAPLRPLPERTAQGLRIKY